MKYLGQPFKQDNKGIFFVDSCDVNTELFYFNEVKNSYATKRRFYSIEGIDDYIIKDTTKLPALFNEYRTKRILRDFMNNQDKFADIDFPVGYYLDNDKIKGTVIPYYKDSISIRQLIYIFPFQDLKKYYLQDDDDTRNLILLCLDILQLIERMYQEDIVYTDIHAGNFLVYNNSIKVIDFEPDYVHFTKRKDKYYKLLLSNYNILVNTIWRRYNYKNMYYSPGESFEDAKDRVKSLIKEKRE